MSEVMHLSISDAELVEFVLAKAKSLDTTPEAYVDGLIRQRARAEALSNAVSFVTAPEVAGRRGRLVRDEEETDAEFEDRQQSHERLLNLFS